MPLIHTRGDPSSRIWIILDHPFPSDIPKGYLLSGGMGYVYEKMFAEAGLDLFNCYVCARRPDTDNSNCFSSVDSALLNFQPPLIFAVNEVGQNYFPELRPKSIKDTYKTQLNKYVGSLLSTDHLQYPHYMMPLYGPDKCAQDWTERNITTYIDLQKMKDEFDFWKAKGSLNPLPIRRLLYDNFDLADLLKNLDTIANTGRVSTDIETIYPKAGSAYYPHPGYAIVLGMASSSNDGISFSLFRDSPYENRLLWRRIDDILSSVEIIGQNFINFDSYFLSATGFRVNIKRVQDTLIRHHILWPELSHKLQFMTRQYTREPYYKDEGKHWSMKHLGKLKRYNALDVTVTYEVFDAQEEEFKDRPHLKGVAA